MSAPQPTLPTDLTLAFAAAIISSKPPDLSVRAYLSLLRNHTAPGRRENALSAAYRHLDRSAFWRAESERANESLRVAESARIEAVREVESLRGKLAEAEAGAGGGAGSGTAGAGGKRKRGGESVIAFERDGKKPRRDGTERREVFLGKVVVEEVEGEGDGCDALMRSLYQIGLCFKPGVHVEVTTLAHYLISAAEEISNMILGALGQYGSADSPTGDRLPTTLIAAGRVVAGILAGVQKLHRLDESKSATGQVTYAIVNMYKKLMSGLEVMSAHEARQESHDSSSTDPKTIPPKQKPKKAGPPRVNIKDIPAMNMLTSLLSGIIKHLDPKQPSHQDLFEGFLFCILSKLGKNIYTTTFTRPRGASISEEIQAETTPDETDELSQVLQQKRQPPPSLRQALLEAPYLIYLLKQLLPLTPTFLEPASKKPSNKPNPKTASKPSNASKPTLSLLAKQRLQNTLVTGIFGTEGVEEDSDLLLNCLRAPVAATLGSVPVPRVKETEVGEWFTGEVWRLVGWEGLGREVAGDGGRV